MKVTCSTCGGPVTFKSRASVFGVCPYCKSMLVRSDVTVESIGTMSEVPRDMSPFQIGTSGRFEKTKFEVVGRSRIAWENGSWNEWYLVFENGKTGWLADAQGQNMVSFEIENSLASNEIRKLGVSDALRLQDKTYNVIDRRDVRCVASEGELPTVAKPGQTYLSVDLKGAGETFAGLSVSDEGVLSFAGKFVDLEELSLENLRMIDGW